MYTVRPPFFYKLLYHKAIYRVKEEGKSLFLTFDDGPIPEVTPRVLQILEEFSAKATFFCIGKNIRNNPRIIDQIIAAGHSLGNHTFNHLNGWKVKKEDYMEDILKCERQFRESADQQINLFRPPYGRIKPSQYSILNAQYSIIMWDVLSGDFDKNTTKEECLDNVLSKTREGSVIVFHDSLKAKDKLYYVLPRILKHFTEKGFSFKAINPALPLQE
jgi:peptidoglycan-N-acetylglucosamine deacetylase